MVEFIGIIGIVFSVITFLYGLYSKKTKSINKAESEFVENCVTSIKKGEEFTEKKLDNLIELSALSNNVKPFSIKKRIITLVRIVDLKTEDIENTEAIRSKISLLFLTNKYTSIPTNLDFLNLFCRLVISIIATVFIYKNLFNNQYEENVYLYIFYFLLSMVNAFALGTLIGEYQSNLKKRELIKR